MVYVFAFFFGVSLGPISWNVCSEVREQSHLSPKLLTTNQPDLSPTSDRQMLCDHNLYSMALPGMPHLL
jgi:hypothetical protein